MDQFMFGSAITANKDASPAFRQQWPEPFLVSCPEPLKQFFCRNGGECYTGYEDREQGYIKTESKGYFSLIFSITLVFSKSVFRQ
jgi:hypothetical protein